MPGKIVVILTMLLCSMATQLYALGLGTVTVESSLDQPLRVQIELLQLGATRLQDVRVQMASNDDFERFNIERTGFLSNVRFTVEPTPQGNVVILTTAQIVREPYLSFILETRWPTGRLLSEHTLLMDLPVFDDRSSVAEIRQPISPILQQPSGIQTDTQPFVEPATVPTTVTPGSSSSAENLQPEQIAPAVEVEENSEPEPEAVEPDVEVVDPVVEDQVVVVEENISEEVAESEQAEPGEITEEAIEETGPEAEGVAQETEETEPEVALEEAVESVEPGQAETQEAETIATDGSDTLSDIALQVRPDNSVSMQQTMLAIQQLNPEAFSDGNINRLRNDQVLRVPTIEEIEAIDPRAAVDEVARQNQDFADTDVQPLTAPAAAVPARDDAARGQLSVVSADDAIDATDGAAELGSTENGALDQRIAALETQLVQRQEEADRARIEREELDFRMQDLEAQIAAAQEIIRLQDIQLAQLQESLAAAAEARLAAEPQAIQAAAEAEAALSVDPPSSLFDDVLRILTGNSLFMIFGIVLLILLLVVLLLRRNRAAQLGEEDEIAEQEFDGGDELVTEDTEFQDHDSSDLDSGPDDIIGIPEDDEEGRKEDHEETDSDEQSSKAPSQLDVLATADQLVMDQRFGRAVGLLNTSLQEQGDNPDVHAKIAEIKATQRGFLAAQQLREESSGAEAEAAAAAASQESETKSFFDDLGIDLDLLDYGDDQSEASSSASPAVGANDQAKSAEPDEMDITFDLGGGEETVIAEEDDSVSKDVTDQDEPSNEDSADAGPDSYDFDFDLDEFEAELAKETGTQSSIAEEDDFLSFDDTAETASTESTVAEVSGDDDLSFDAEIEFDIDDEPEQEVSKSVAKETDLIDHDDLEFLSGDDVEIESADDVEEVELFSDDEIATKLDLAYAYQNMGDTEGAREILQEVIKEGSDEQIDEANKLLGTLEDNAD